MIQKNKNILALQKEKIQKQKKQLKEKENKIKVAEQKSKVKILISLGKIIEKAGINHLNSKELLGAFLTLKDQSKDTEILNAWVEKARRFSEKMDQENKTPLIISFSQEITDITKSLLRRNHFKWNNFRKEWYGFGSKKKIENLLVGLKVKIQEVEN